MILCFLMIKANSQCNNVTYPGEIGINEPVNYGQISSLIRNIELPSGGDTTKRFEYIWLMTTDSLTTVGINWNVSNVSYGYDSTYQHTAPIYTKTWFRRCARREGCSSYVGESNWLQVLAPNFGLPLTIKNIYNNQYTIAWEVYEEDLFTHLLLKGSYGKDWKELGIYTEHTIDISKFNYTYYQLYFYDIDNKLTLSNIIYINKRIIEDDSLNGKQYVIYGINGQVLKEGVFYKCIHLKENEIIKFY